MVPLIREKRIIWTSTLINWGRGFNRIEGLGFRVHANFWDLCHIQKCKWRPRGHEAKVAKMNIYQGKSSLMVSSESVQVPDVWGLKP